VKDIRKQIDALFGRVEKHFGAGGGSNYADLGGLQPGSALPTSRLAPNSAFGLDNNPNGNAGGGGGRGALPGVWKACEGEVLRITEVFQKLIAQCYANSGVSLEYGPADVRDVFKRHKVQ